MAKRVALALAAVALCFPAAAQANGDPASDYLLVQDLFLPFNSKIDAETVERLRDVIKGAEKGGYKIKVALILTRYDLGTAFSLYNKPRALRAVSRARALVHLPGQPARRDAEGLRLRRQREGRPTFQRGTETTT